MPENEMLSVMDRLKLLLLCTVGTVCCVMIVYLASGQVQDEPEVHHSDNMELVNDANQQGIAHEELESASTSVHPHTITTHTSIFISRAMNCNYSTKQNEATGRLIASPQPNETPEAIQRDLKRCSLAMGVSPETLRRDSNTLRIISEKASSFLSAIWSVVPRTFSPQFKSPCWYANKEQAERIQCMFQEQRSFYETPKGTILCFPYFFLAGFPKSATSTLYHALARHPSIANQITKEPQWWTRGPLGNDALLKNRSYHRTAVLSYFAVTIPIGRAVITNDSRDIISCDGSQSTLYDSNFFVKNQEYCAMPAVVAHVLPRSKFLVIMRNPVTRVYSHYIHTCNYQFGDDIENWPSDIQQNPAVYFHKQVVSLVEDFKGCLKQSSLFECVSMYTSKKGLVGLHLMVSIYYVHILKWLQFFPKDQFLFMRMDDVYTNPKNFTNRITNFLEVDNNVPIVSSMLARRFKSRKFQLGNPNIEIRMRNESRTLLEEFYAPYNAMLTELLDDKRFLWKE